MYEEAGKRDKETALQKLEKISQEIGAEFYNDQFGNTVVEIKKRVFEIEDPVYKALLSEQFYDNYGDVFSESAFRKHLSLGISKALKRNPKFYPRRIHRVGYSIFYDSGEQIWEFCNGQYKVFNSNDESCPVIFRRYSDFKPAKVEPTEESPKDIINSIVDQYRHDGIHWSFIVSFFEPYHSHPIAMITGEPGSAKSTFTEIIKDLVDPSIVNRIDLPEKASDFDTYREKFYVCNYDNVRKITAEQADDLCRQVTGSSSVKRKLYTNAGLYLTSGKPRITINGVKPEPSAFNDLLDRFYPVFLRRMKKNKDENTIKKEINEIIPRLRFACLLAVSKSIAVDSDNTRSDLPRLAEFSLLCENINILYGGTKGEFINHYKEKMRISHNAGLDDQFASVLIAYIEAHSNTKMRYSALEWYQKIKEWSEEKIEVDSSGYGKSVFLRPDFAALVSDKDFLKSPVAIGRRFRELNQILDNLGYVVDYDRENTRNIIQVMRK